ncbi:MAG: VCBS repeat-containing protein [Elusimicrobia bacterium]|nr:VCBS repeat-containing protein [Elusimicrobiota bacterium]
MRKFLFLLAVAALCPAARAATDGVVVKVDGASVFLDLGAGSAVQGAAFEVLRAGPELKHPVTGESLGPVWERQGKGTVSQVEEKYSIGSLSEGKAETGWKARLLGAAAAPMAPAPAVPAAADSSARTPLLKSPFFDFEAVDIAVGDVDGDGLPEAVLADAEHVTARRMDGAWPELCAYVEKATGARILSIEARDLDGDGRAEVFATVHNRLAGAVETHVLDCKDGRLVVRTTLPWLVRSYGTEQGTRALAGQSLEPDAKFPTSRVHRLVYAAGAYALEKPSFPHKRLDWLYGFAFAPAQGEPILLHYNRAQKLTLRFKKGTWNSPEALGYGPTRLSWHGADFHMHPRLFTRLEGGELKSVCSVRNIPRLLGLASAFGIYSGADLQCFAFNGMSLDPAWKADLSGMAAGLDEVPASGAQAGRLAVAVVGANGRTAVWVFPQ